MLRVLGRTRETLTYHDCSGPLDPAIMVFLLFFPLFSVFLSIRARENGVKNTDCDPFSRKRYKRNGICWVETWVWILRCFHVLGFCRSLIHGIIAIEPFSSPQYEHLTSQTFVTVTHMGFRGYGRVHGCTFTVKIWV